MMIWLWVEGDGEEKSVRDDVELTYGRHFHWYVIRPIRFTYYVFHCN